MGKSLFGGLFKATLAASAVAGLAYLFKDEIKGTPTYQNLNEKYDVDTKLSEATKKAKEAAIVAKKKAKEAAVVAKDKAYDLKDKAVDAYKKSSWASSDEDIFADDEIVLDEESSEERDYVEINTAEAAEEAAEKVEEVAEKAEEAAANFDAIADAAAEEKNDAVDNIEID